MKNNKNYSKKKKAIRSDISLEDMNPEGSLGKIEMRLLSGILVRSLALHMLRNRRTPLSEVLASLADMEGRVADFVAKTLHQEIRDRLPRGILGQAYAMIPLSRSFVSRAPKKPTKRKSSKKKT